MCILVDVHTRMQEVSEMVQENMQQAQIKQKIWYNQKSLWSQLSARRSSPVATAWWYA